MSTEELNTKSEKGQLGDDQDFLEWNACTEYYQDWENRRQALTHRLVLDINIFC